MNDKKYTIATRIIADSASFKSGVRESQSSLRRFVNSSKKDIDSLKHTWNSFAGKMATVGLGLGAYEIAKGTALLDKQLGKVAISAKKSAEETASLREQLESLELKTGKNAGDLATAFEEIFSLTGSWDIARKSIEAVNTTLSTTNATATVLGESLGAAQTNFGMDLTKPGAAQEIFNKLAGAGAGAGGIGNVAAIFKDIAPMAQLSGMNFDDTIKLISTMSQVTKNPGQIGAYTEQILRAFTNVKSISNKKSTIGKLIFGESGERRAPLEILQGIKETYDSLDEKKRADFLSSLTGGGDAKGLKTIQMLLESSALKNIKTLEPINLEKNLPRALNNAADQAARLKEYLEDAAESFAKPIDKAIANAIQWALDQKNLSGGDIAGGGLVALLSAWLIGKKIKGPLGKLLGGKIGVAGGVAEGLALSKAGVMPVYVVNFSEMMGIVPGMIGGSALPGILKKAPGLGLLGSIGLPAVAAALVAACLYGAYRTNQNYLESRMTHIREMTEAEKYPLFAEDNFSNQRQMSPGAFSGAFSGVAGSTYALKNDIKFEAYFNGEKQKPVKTVIYENTGKF